MDSIDSTGLNRIPMVSCRTRETSAALPAGLAPSPTTIFCPMTETLFPYSAMRHAQGSVWNPNSTIPLSLISGLDV